MSDELEQIRPNSVDAREGLALGEYAVYEVARIASLRRQLDAQAAEIERLTAQLQKLEPIAWLAEEAAKERG